MYSTDAVKGNLLQKTGLVRGKADIGLAAGARPGEERRPAVRRKGGMTRTLSPSFVEMLWDGWRLAVPLFFEDWPFNPLRANRRPCRMGGISYYGNGVVVAPGKGKVSWEDV
jgi:hypothetical protein